MIKKMITITEQQDDWLKAEIAQGGYSDASELVRALIRDRQQQDRGETPEEVVAIRTRLVEAEKDGLAEDFDKHDWLKTIKEQLRVRL